MSLNARQSETVGRSLHIGVADTLGEPPEWLRSGVAFAGIYDDYVDTDQGDPIGHGTTVLKTVARNAPEAVYSTFQIAGEKDGDGEYAESGRRGDLVSAVSDAADAGVDLLNISAGISHECGGLCSLAREVELAVSVDDMCVVAATGNRDPSTPSREGLNCPALTESTLGVAGFMPHCEAESRTDDSSQWWLLDGNREQTVPFCGYRECCGEQPCDTNRQEVCWDGNVSFHNAFPDVFAPPVAVDIDQSGELVAQLGTSFAAPLVTGLLAAIQSDMLKIDSNPTPSELRTAVRAGGVELDEEGYYKMDCQNTWDELRE